MRTINILPGMTITSLCVHPEPLESKPIKCSHCGTVRYVTGRCESCGSPHVEGPRHRDVFECNFGYVATNPTIRMNYVKPPEKGWFGRFIDRMNTHDYDGSIY